MPPDLSTEHLRALLDGAIPKGPGIRYALDLAAEVLRLRDTYEQPCTCGSGGHPRECRRHPDRYRMHIAELNAEIALTEMDEMREEIERLRAALDGAALKDLP